MSVNFGHCGSLQGHLILVPSRIHAIEAAASFATLWRSQHRWVV